MKVKLVGVDRIEGVRFKIEKGENIPVYIIWLSLYHSYEYIKPRSSVGGMHKIAVHCESKLGEAAGGSAHRF